MNDFCWDLYFVEKQGCPKERNRLGHHPAQRPGDDQNDLLPFPEYPDGSRQGLQSPSLTHPPSILPRPQVQPQLPEMSEAPADPYPQGRAPALVADQQPAWPGPQLYFQQEVLRSVYSERYCNHGMKATSRLQRDGGAGPLTVGPEEAFMIARVTQCRAPCSPGSQR